MHHPVPVKHDGERTIPPRRNEIGGNLPTQRAPVSQIVDPHSIAIGHSGNADLEGRVSVVIKVGLEIFQCE